jgi:hypothetical protein
MVEVPTLPKVLGYSGVVPFVILSAALWIAPANYQAEFSRALIAYGAVILSFMGAIHWGIAIRMQSEQEHSVLGYSVVPALLAWLAMIMPELYSYAVLLVAFVILCLVDSRLTSLQLAPNWYPLLRIPLTAIVAGSLITAQLAIVLE